MAKLILFQNPVPYKWVKEAFTKAIDEYLPLAKFNNEDLVTWKKYLSYLINHENPYIADRTSNMIFKEACTYLELQAIPNQPIMNLYDGIDRPQNDVWIYDDYPIKGIFLTPEIQHSSSKIKKSEENLGKYIKTIVDRKASLETAKDTHKKAPSFS